MHRRLVEQVAVLRFTVVAESLAVIADDDDGRRTARAAFERLDQPAQFRVHVRHFAEVRARRMRAPERLGRRVGVMGIPIVHPQEQRRGRSALECRHGRVGDLSRGALLPALRQAVVVDVEPAGQPESPGKDEARHDSGGPITRAFELRGQDRRRIGQPARVLVDAVPGRIEPRHQGRMRRQRLGNRRVGLTEAAPPRGHRVEGRGRDVRRLRPDRIRACGVERHQQDRGTRGGLITGFRCRFRPGAARGGGHCPEHPYETDCATNSREDSTRLRRPAPLRVGHALHDTCADSNGRPGSQGSRAAGRPRRRRRRPG